MAQHNPTTGPAPATVSELFQRFGERWTIAYEAAPAVWSAERRSPDGRRRRFICDQNPADLAAKLTAAEAGQ